MSQNKCRLQRRPGVAYDMKTAFKRKFIQPPPIGLLNAKFCFQKNLNLSIFLSNFSFTGAKSSPLTREIGLNIVWQCVVFFKDFENVFIATKLEEMMLFISVFTMF